MTLLILAIAWLLGIVAADILHLPIPPLAAAAIFCALVAAAAGRAPRLRLVALALACAALGGVVPGKLSLKLHFISQYFRKHSVQRTLSNIV